MSLHKDQIDQDALAAEWGLALEADAANALQSQAPTDSGETSEAHASQWAAMVEDDQFTPVAKGGGASTIVVSKA